MRKLSISQRISMMLIISVISLLIVGFVGLFVAKKESESIQQITGDSCLVSYDHISQRILKLATAHEVLGSLLADLKAQRL